MSYRMLHTLRRLMCDKFSVLCTMAELNERQLKEEDTMRVNTKVKLLHPDAVVPKYAHEDDVCFDLVAIEDVIIEPGQTKKIPTGIALQPPPSYWIDIRPRSGISEKTKLRISNSPGTIDAYTGEIGVLFDNIATHTNRTRQFVKGLDGKHEKTTRYLDENTYIIRKGDRVAQALVTLKYRAMFTVVDELQPTERGTNGFGSSGVKSKEGK
jgi:dUTP pyrophosphatase